MTSSNVILNEETLREAVAYFQTKRAMTFDFESMGENRGICHLNRLSWLSMATEGATVVVPFGHPIGSRQIGTHKEPRLCADGKTRNYTVPDWEDPPEQISPANVFEITRPLFFDERITKIAHGAVFDISSGAKYWGEVPPGPWDDTIICDWLLNENRHQYKLKVRTKEMFGFQYDDEEVGRCIEKHPFNKVAYYSYCDAKFPWLMWNQYRPQIAEQGLNGVHELELDVLNVLVGMRLAGSHIDVPRLEELKVELTQDKIDAEKAVYIAAGAEFNLNSAPQKQHILFDKKRDGGQALKPWKPTGKGKEQKDAGEKVTAWSTDDEVLESFPLNPVCAALRDFGDVDKLLGTYVLGYLGDPDDKDKPCQIYDGRIFADFVQYGAKTGRFSCVSGDTLLRTSRGTFRFDEYFPVEGDLVPTHEGRWQPVLRKIYKGRAKMYRVSLYNGAELKCTADHRVFTPGGWRYVRELRPGDMVYSYDGFQEVYAGSGEDRTGSGAVLSEPAKAHHYAGGRNDGHPLAQRTCGIKTATSFADIEERTEAAVLAVQDERPEPDERQEWFPSPQLQGSGRGRQRLSSDQGGRRVHTSSQIRDGASLGLGEASALAGRSSHRRGHIQQRCGQPGAGNDIWSREVARQEIQVREIASLGAMGVWDIEVAGDHSYATHGFLNHNCRRPNLQNIPRPDTERGKVIRGAWVAEDGWSLVVVDYSQIELVMFAHFAGYGALFDGFWKGIDPHTTTACSILGKPIDELLPEERQLYGKRTNFALGFGAGKYKVASMLGITVEEAEFIMERHQKAMPELYKLKDGFIRECRSNGYVRTLLGRKRRIPEIYSNDWGMRGYAERQAGNAPIQGSAADLQKLAMVRTDTMLGEQVPDAFLSLSVHDELVVETPETEADKVALIVKEAMTGSGIQELIKVPLSVDVKVVKRWSEAK